MVAAFFLSSGNIAIVLMHFAAGEKTSYTFAVDIIVGAISYYYSFNYIIMICLPYIVFIVLLLTASVMRKKRMRAALSEANKKDADSTKAENGYYGRVRHNGCAVAGNILSGISYVAMLFGVKLLFESFSLGFSIALIGISLVCGFIAWLLFRYAVGYGYGMGAVTMAIYIWSWIPAIIIIALIVISILLMCAFTEAEFSTVVNKKVYKVIDENGEVRTLDYNGKDIYSKCKDDKGEWWETFDGGSTFKK